jgi:hypothetical protein
MNFANERLLNLTVFVEANWRPATRRLQAAAAEWNCFMNM